jgi:hypothetical protein
MNSDGFIERLNFIDYDKQTTKSVDNNDDPTWTTKTIALEKGERVKSVNVINEFGKYKTLQGNCARADDQDLVDGTDVLEKNGKDTSKKCWNACTSDN